MKVDPKLYFFIFLIRKKTQKPETLLPAIMVSPKKQKNILCVISDSLEQICARFTS